MIDDGRVVRRRAAGAEPGAVVVGSDDLEEVKREDGSGVGAVHLVQQDLEESDGDGGQQRAAYEDEQRVPEAMVDGGRADAPRGVHLRGVP